MKPSQQALAEWNAIKRSGKHYAAIEHETGFYHGYDHCMRTLRCDTCRHASPLDTGVKYCMDLKLDVGNDFGCTLHETHST